MRYKIQPSEFVDRIASDGTEMTRLPYPIIVNQEGFGQIGHKEVHLVGFTDDPNVRDLSIYWSDVAKDLKQAIGRYAVIQENGQWSTLVTAIKSAEEI